MVRITFVGDIMLGRFVAEKYRNNKYSLFSGALLSELNNSDYRIANLESPIVKCESDESLRFAGDPMLLQEVKWVDFFSLSNNHINDFGSDGMTETIKHLDEYGIKHNGLYQASYEPILIEKNGQRIVVITCADMMNYEFADDCPYQTLRMGNGTTVLSTISRYKQQGFFVILYLHAGMLFSRYLNPIVREFAHSAIDSGASAVITAHSHCLGGYEFYRGGLIVNSLGDFLMDGSSFRRREACMLNLDVEDSEIKRWEMIPTVTSISLETDLAIGKDKARMLKRIESVSGNIERKSDSYNSFYKRQYKIEMLQHSLSTLRFEFKRRGLLGSFKILWNRMGDVTGMTKRLLTDRSKMSYDSDAVKSVSNKSIK